MTIFNMQIISALKMRKNLSFDIAYNTDRFATKKQYNQQKKKIPYFALKNTYLQQKLKEKKTLFCAHAKRRGLIIYFLIA
jgi:hypothetical protein